MGIFDAKKLEDFWDFYDDRNPFHQKAVAKLTALLPESALSDDAEWVKIYRTEYTPPKPPEGTSVAADESSREEESKFNSSTPIDWGNFGQLVSPHFTVGEFLRFDRRRIPRDSTVKKNIIAIANELEWVRDQYGKPIRITSGYRPPAVNRACGGARRSQHLTGSAVDISPIGGSVYDLQKWLDSKWDKALGFGAKRGFVHLDLRPGRIRWNY